MSRPHYRTTIKDFLNLVIPQSTPWTSERQTYRRKRSCLRFHCSDWSCWPFCPCFWRRPAWWICLRSSLSCAARMQHWRQASKSWVCRTRKTCFALLLVSSWRWDSARRAHCWGYSAVFALQEAIKWSAWSESCEASEFVHHYQARCLLLVFPEYSIVLNPGRH